MSLDCVELCDRKLRRVQPVTHRDRPDWPCTALIRRNFIQYAKVFPGSRLLGMTIDPKLYRLAVGWYEVVCGTILVLVPGRVKQASNCALLVLMLGAVYTHAALKDRFERMAPSIVFVLMLVCRLVVFYQVQSREKARAPEAARPKAD